MPKHDAKKQQYRKKRAFQKRLAFPSPDDIFYVRKPTLAKGLLDGFKILFDVFVTFCLWAVGALIGALIVAWPSTYLNDHWETTDWLTVIIGIVWAGVVLCCMFSTAVLLRRLCQRLKKSYLRRRGITVQVTVMDWGRSTTRGPKGGTFNRFHLTLRWRHPETDRSYTYECIYMFNFFMSNEEEELFVNQYKSGAHLSLIFSPRHPRYFVLDIPFAPCWFDILF